MSNFTARYSGHQTFPLRYGWLYKYVTSASPETTSVEELMVEWGVGKNMVDAIKYWAAEVLATAELRSEYLTIHDADPYLENMNSIWALHWLLTRHYKQHNAYRVFFNYFNGQKFTRESLAEFTNALYQRQKFSTGSNNDKVLQLPNASSLKKDIGVFTQMYSKQASSSSEDSFVSPLSELELVRETSRGQFISPLGNPASLSDEVFTYCLVDYLHRELDTKAATIAFDTLLTQPGSPARIFRLNQSALERRLDAAQAATEGMLGWTDTAGLRQIQITDRAVFEQSFRSSLLSNIWRTVDA